MAMRPRCCAKRRAPASRRRFAERPLAAGSTREDYRARLEFELDVIIKMKFPGYFLIVADFVKHAKSKGIPVGPGRGSGAGSLVAYSLTITDLDPIRFNLLFERFLNPERVSMPDFDIDFCQDRRDEVIDYVQERHGKERVAQIITFGKLQARAVCRDVGRVLQMPYGQVDRLCKLIPMNPANPVTAGAGHRGRAAAPGRARQGPGRQDHAGDRAQARGPLSSCLDACRRHRHRRSPAGRTGAALSRSALVDSGHPVQHEICREGRAREVRLSRPQDADRHRQGAATDPPARAGLRHIQDSARR